MAEHVKSSRYLKRKFAKIKATEGNARLTFKAFVRSLAKGGDAQATEWFKHKSAAWNVPAKQARLKLKGPRISAEKTATKNARRKSKSKVTTTTTEVKPLPTRN